METIHLLILIAILLSHIYSLRLRSRLKDHEKVLKSYEEFKFREFDGVNTEISNLHTRSFELEDKINGIKSTNITSKEFENLCKNINGVAEYNIQLSHKISDLEKRLPKKKVTRRK